MTLPGLLVLLAAAGVPSTRVPDVVLCAEAQAPEYSSELMARVAQARALDAPGALVEIRIAAGSFTPLSSMQEGFDLLTPCAVGEACVAGKTLRFVGGYLPGSQCSERAVRTLQTAFSIDGRGLRVRGDFDIELDGLYLQGGEVLVDNRRCADCGAQRRIRLSHNRFENSLGLTVHAGHIEVANNVFVSHGPVRLGSAEHPPQTLHLLFNTVARTWPGFGPIVQVSSRSGRAHVHHNLLATGSEPSLAFDVVAGAEPLVHHNLYGAITLTPPLALAPGSGSNLVGADPGFIDESSSQVHLRSSPPAPAIDAGLSAAELAAAGIAPPGGELLGAIAPRLTGTRFDLGAYESAGAADAVFASGFE